MPNTPRDAEVYELLLPSEEPGKLLEPAASTMGREEQLTKPEGRKGDDVAYYTALTAATLTLLVSSVLVFSNKPTDVGWFALHPLLEPLALVVFTYGILTLQPTSQPKTKAAGLARHQVVFLCLGVPFMTFGTFAVVYFKWLKDKHHFKSWHGKFGITCMAWVVAQVALGGGSVWFGGAAFGGGMKAKALWKYHRLSGYVLFPLLLLTLHLGGAWSHWGAKHAPYGVRLVAYTISPAIIAAAVLFRVRTSKMKFL